MVGSKGDSSARREPPDGAPDTAFERARRRWFEEYGASIVMSSRLWVIVFIQGAIILALAAGYLLLLPLKEIRPYMVEIDDQSGRVTATAVGSSQYQPGERELKYFLAKFAVQLYEIDPFKTEQNYRDLYEVVTDKARLEVRQFLDEQVPFKRIKEDNSLTRTVQVVTVSFLQGKGGALIRIRTTETTGANPPVHKNILLTVHYVHEYPTDEEIILKNPLGLYVTHWSKTEEVIK